MIEKSFQTQGPPRLDLRVPAGEIVVEAGAASGVELTVDGPPELLEKTRVEQRGDTVVVDAESLKSWFSWRDRGLHVRVRCPEGATLAARSKSGDIRADGILGCADVASASGDISLESVLRDVSMKSASGDLSVRSVGGTLVANTASGDVEAGSVAGTVRVNGVSGDVEIGSAAADVEVASVSGDATVRAVHRGSVRVNAVSGDVEVGIRRGSRVHVDASTLSGDTHSELDLGDDDGAGGGPVVELRVKTVSGDVSVVRAPALEEQEVQS